MLNRESNNQCQDSRKLQHADQRRPSRIGSSCDADLARDNASTKSLAAGTISRLGSSTMKRLPAAKNGLRLPVAASCVKKALASHAQPELADSSVSVALEQKAPRSRLARPTQSTRPTSLGLANPRGSPVTRCTAKPISSNYNGTSALPKSTTGCNQESAPRQLPPTARQPPPPKTRAKPASTLAGKAAVAVGRRQQLHQGESSRRPLAISISRFTGFNRTIPKLIIYLTS